MDTVDSFIIESLHNKNNSMAPKETTTMPSGTDKFHAILEAEMSMIPQSGRIAQNNFITVSKAQDLDYVEGKRLVSLEEAIGVREVSSRSVPAGPEAG